MPLVLTTGFQLMAEAVQAQAGQTILVTGATGSVGRTALFVGKRRGARMIAGVRKQQLSAAVELGAEHR